MTRAVVKFNAGSSNFAIIYKHDDGYPEDEDGMLALLGTFFATVRRECQLDTRFDDPAYLAAKFVVYLARKSETEARLDFHGVGIVNSIPGDVEYVYTLDCQDENDPKISYIEY